jgi:hypothetical protein
VDEEMFTEGKLIQENLVVRVVRSMIQQNKVQQPILIVEHYTVFNDRVNGVIGEPIYYD